MSRDYDDEPYVLVIDGFKGRPKANRPKTTVAGKTKDSSELSAIETQMTVLAKSASSQITEDDFNYTADGLIEPLWNFEQLCELSRLNTTRSSCIEAMATNVARLGYRVKKVDPGVEEQDTDDVSEQIVDFLERCSERGGLSFADLIYQVKKDEETIGNGYIEVTRDRLGRVAGFYHVPAQTVRRRKEKNGYVQERGGRKVAFYNFGDKYKITKDGRHELRKDRDPHIRELIHFKLYSSGSSYYGEPRDLSTINTIYGDNLALNHNIKFFTYGATPEFLLIFEVDHANTPQSMGKGPIRVTIPESTKREIEDHFRRNLSAPTFEPGIFHLPPGVKLRIEKLSEIKQDSSWSNYRKENRAEIRMAHRTPAVLIADSEGGGNYAASSMEVARYLEGVIQPEQRRYERELMAAIWPELTMIKPETPKMVMEEDGKTSRPPATDVKPKKGTGVNRNIWKLEFKRMSVNDAAMMAQIHNIYGTLQVITKNEIRADLGKKPMKGGDVPPNPKGGAEGNALAQNADMKQVAAGNRDMDAFVSNMAPPGNDDITGFRGAPGGGRKESGRVSVPKPRRVGERGAPQAANLYTAGHPVSKSDNGVVMSREDYEELVKQATRSEVLESTEEETTTDE